MIHNLKPYPAYKNSGVPWLGKVPEHWEVRRLGTLGTFSSSGIDKKTAEKEPRVRLINYLDVYKNTTHELSNGRNYMYVSCPEWKRQAHSAKCGDMFFTPSSETYEDIGWSAVAVEDLENTVYSYHLIRFRPYNELNSRFQKYWCNNDSVFQQLSLACKGTTRKILTRGNFRNILILLPSLPEQSSIARFLDYYDRRIRHYIRAKHKLIKLLEELRAAIIHHAVTHGLDPDVHFKPSGLEWLGDVPEHWDVRPAKYFYREVDERSETGSEELLSVSHITGVTPRSQKNITMFMASSYVGHKVCKTDDLVINTMWAWMGALGVSRQTGIVSPSYAVYRPLQSTLLIGEYAELLLRTRPYVDEYVCRSTGIRSSRLRLYPEQFLRIHIICPPVTEQCNILEHLSAETNYTEKAIDSAKREITLLREYRTRLIADVVTGKLDVREAAARLPDEAKEPELFKEDDDLSGLNEGQTEDLHEVPEEIEAL